MMKLVTLFLFAACLQLSAKTSAQGISLALNNASLSAAFSEIQQQTSFRFIYTNEQLAASSKVSLSVQNASLEKVLELCFKDQPLSYAIEEKFIIVKTIARKNLIPADSIFLIRGRVSNESGEALEAASIVLKGTSKATYTSKMGIFSLPGIPRGAVLIISSVGYRSQEIVTSNDYFLNIHMQVLVSGLDEMVIKGYYSTSKRLNTGNVSKVSASEIEKQTITNPLQALEGRVPGLSVLQSTGLPGGAFRVNIRGRNSIANGNDPFYIVDGVPYTSSQLASSYTSATTLGGNPLNSINPSDIESIEILKDADATAIYGSRAANGVILITTKKGKVGKTRLDLNVNTGNGAVARKLHLLNTPQYLSMRHEAFNNDGVVTDAGNAPDLLLWDTTRNTDWQKMAYGNTARVTDVQATISGGNANTQFRVGGGVHRESTVFNGDFADRKASVQVNIVNSSTDQKFKMNVSASFISDNNRLPYVDITQYINTLPPNAPPIYNNNGELNWENNFYNPFSYLLDKYKVNTENLIGNGQLSYQLHPALQFKVNLGYNSLNMREIATIPRNSFDPAYHVLSGFANYASSSVKSWIAEPQIQYTQHINKKNTVIILAGTTFQESVQESLTESGSNYSDDALLENLAAAGSISVYASNYAKYRYNALFGRINYNHDDKYLLNLTARRDGSSRFGSENQFANFGAAGAAWIFSKELFFQKKLRFISFGKLRASYGSSGNDQIPNYGYLSLWSPTEYSYQGNPGLTTSRLANPNYGWERNRKLEVGLELGFLRDRFLFGISYYRNRADNQLVGYPVPILTGQSSVQGNLPAVIRNQGIELDATLNIVRSNNFTWTTGFNLSIPRNTLISYPGLENSSYKNVYVVGKSLYVKKLFHSTGVDPKTGIYQFQDVNGNGSGTDYPSDLQDLKELSQRYFGGWHNSFQYKRFRIDFLFQFVKQQGLNYLYGGFSVPGSYGNQPVYVLDRWQRTGDNAPVQKFTQDYTAPYDAYSNLSNLSDAYISDASFIRLRNVFISYELSAKWMDKIHLSYASVYLSGQNLLTITNYKGVDPESQNAASVPPLRVISAGIKLTF